MKMKMMMHNKANAGFSLLELAIVLIVVGIMLSGTLIITKARIAEEELVSTKQIIGATEGAIASFLLINGRLPCPADPSLTRSHANFGIEVTSSGECTTAGSNLISDGNVFLGMLPTKTLGIGDELAIDGYANRIMYGLYKTYASSNSSSFTNPPTTSPNNLIIVNDGNGTARTSNAVLVLFSAGKNGYGAFSYSGVRKSSALISTDEEQNMNISSMNNTFVQKQLDSSFDDILIFRTPLQMAQLAKFEALPCQSYSQNYNFGSYTADVAASNYPNDDGIPFGSFDTITISGCSAGSPITSTPPKRYCGAFGQWGPLPQVCA